MRQGTVRLGIIRRGAWMEVEVAPHLLGVLGTDRVVLWAGLLLQRPHPALARHHGLKPEGVYISLHKYGSPGNRHGLRATQRIMAVDGVATPDLDAFLAAVAGRGDRDPVRLTILDLMGRERVRTLKLDLQHWPTVELRWEADGWVRLTRAAGGGL